MRLTASRPPLPAGARLGVILGLAIALSGIAVGVAAGASSSAPVVYVGNTSASPVPVTVVNQSSAQTVTGTVSVSNLPSNQTVTVSNFPATQPISGTVTVAGAVVSKGYRGSTGSFSVTHMLDFGRTINVTMLAVDNPNSDELLIQLETPFGSTLIARTDGRLLQNFTTPVPATGVLIICGNQIEDCSASVDVFGT